MNYSSITKASSPRAGLRIWPKDSREARRDAGATRQEYHANPPPAADGSVRLRGLAGLSEFIEKAAPEIAANAMPVCCASGSVSCQTPARESGPDLSRERWLHREPLPRSEPEKELLRQADRSDRSDQSDRRQVRRPRCPDCGKPMRLRTAPQGLGGWQAFGDALDRTCQYRPVLRPTGALGSELQCALAWHVTRREIISGLAQAALVI